MIYEYWLAGIEGISNLKKRKLREVYGNGKAIYYIEETNLKKHTFLNEKDIERLKKAKKTVNLEMQWEKSVKKKIKFVPYFSDNYPKKMKVITDPPYALYVLGSLPDENVKSAAIVGARNCTSYGEQMALQYGKCLGHRTAEPEKAHQHGTVRRHLVYGERCKLRQKSTLQRQPIPHAELSRNFYKRHN